MGYHEELVVPWHDGEACYRVRSVMPRAALQIDLRKDKLLHCSGYADVEPRAVGPQVRAKVQCTIGERTFFVRGVFLEMGGVAGFRRHLEAFTDELDVPRWAGRLRGDFTVVAWNHAAGQITAVTGLVGVHRLLVHRSPDGLVTITNRLVSQIQLQPAPRLDDLGVYTLLTFQYPLDPYTLLADTNALTIGDIARVSASGVQLLSYHEPVMEVMENYTSIEECVAELDRTLEQTISEALIDDAVPLLMLSGGIDSVALLSYLTRLAPGRIHSFTFAIEGQKNHELGPARIAADHYRTTHHELVIPSSEVEQLTREALVESDCTCYGGFVHMAISRWLASYGEPLTVFRGEDTRLHTPTLDLPALVGFAAHRVGLHRSAVGRGLWHTRRLASVWPFRKGRNYLRYVLDRTDLKDGLRSYLLKNGSRFASPLDRPMPPELIARTQHLGSWTSMEQAYRAVVGLNCSLQHTEDMHVSQATNETSDNTLTMPFYSPEVVRACNRIPIWMALRPIWAPRKTGSPIPVAAKYVLRKLVAGSAPPELLLRRKSGAPAEDVLHAEAGSRTIFPVIRDWSPVMLDQLQGDTRLIAEHFVRECLDQGLRPPVTQRQGFTSCLFHLATMARLCTDPSLDLNAAMDQLEPWVE